MSGGVRLEDEGWWAGGCAWMIGLLWLGDAVAQDEEAADTTRGNWAGTTRMDIGHGHNAEQGS
eukprot:m.769090 g.769090  ORF g.769090 m.769090 type:complete len:63 (-) comp59078_c1_seq4:78-266(-)